MNSISYDIALISAGAYSLPLCVNAKINKKQAIHLGGSLQLMFGITGNRWSKSKQVHKKLNSHWIRPLKEDRPDNFGMIENGCYW